MGSWVMGLVSVMGSVTVYICLWATHSISLGLFLDTLSKGAGPEEL